MSYRVGFKYTVLDISNFRTSLKNNHLVINMECFYGKP